MGEFGNSTNFRRNSVRVIIFAVDRETSFDWFPLTKIPESIHQDRFLHGSDSNLGLEPKQTLLRQILACHVYHSIRAYTDLNNGIFKFWQLIVSYGIAAIM